MNEALLQCRLKKQKQKHFTPREASRNSVHWIPYNTKWCYQWLTIFQIHSSQRDAFSVGSMSRSILLDVN